MEYSLSSSLVGGSGSINPDGLSLDLQLSTDKSFSKPDGLTNVQTAITARRGPNPVFSRLSTATMVGSDGLIQYAPENLVFPSATLTTQTTTVIAVPYTLSFYGAGTVVLSGAHSQTIFGSGESIRTTLTFTPTAGSLTITVITGSPKLAQLERSSTARQYIPTTTSVVYGPRFDHDPVTLECKGLLIEEQRENILLNSDALSTQSVTVTAIAHTLSFYGTGTIVLSGTAIASITGSGSFPTRTIYTFTPTAGTLTLTVTGSVRYANLERVNSSTGASFATSYIPTTTASLTRSADVCSITGSNFTSFYNQPVGTVVIHGDSWNGTSPLWCSFTKASGGNRTFEFRKSGTDLIHGDASSGSSTISSSPSFPNKFGYTRDLVNGTGSFNGVIAGGTGIGQLASPDQVFIGSGGLGTPLNGCIRSMQYYKKRFSNSKLQTLTT